MTTTQIASVKQHRKAIPMVDMQPLRTACDNFVQELGADLRAAPAAMKVGDLRARIARLELELAQARTEAAVNAAAADDATKLMESAEAERDGYRDAAQAADDARTAAEGLSREAVKARDSAQQALADEVAAHAKTRADAQQALAAEQAAHASTHAAGVKASAVAAQDLMTERAAHAGTKAQLRLAEVARDRHQRDAKLAAAQAAAEATRRQQAESIARETAARASRFDLLEPLLKHGGLLNRIEDLIGHLS